MSNLEDEIGIEETALLLSREKALKEENKAYFDAHPETMHLLNTMLSSMLLQRPDDVFHFASSFFFKYLGQRPPPRRRPLVLCGPAGVGKTALGRTLCERLPTEFGLAVRHTDRRALPGEIAGVDFHFVLPAEYDLWLSRGEFAIEGFTADGDRYGIAFSAVADVADAGKICILEAEPAGCQRLRDSNLRARFIFVQAPSVNDIEKRLRHRATDKEHVIAAKLARLLDDMEAAADGAWDAVVLNDNLEEAFVEVKSRLKADGELVSAKELGPKTERRPCVLVGSYGAGVQELYAHLLAMKDNFCAVPQLTSSAAAAKQVDSSGFAPFQFCERLKMQSMVENGQFMTISKEKDGTLRGTAIQTLQEIQKSTSKIGLMLATVDDALAMPSPPDLGVQFIWAGCELHQLEVRLRESDSETERSISARLQQAHGEVVRALSSDKFAHAIDLSTLTAAVRHAKICLAADLDVDVRTLQRSPLLLSGPSGVGKTALLAQLKAQYVSDFACPVMHTTRAPTGGELDKVHFHFVSKEAFDALLLANKFATYSNIDGHMYATSLAAIEAVIRTGRVCVLDIDIEAVRAIAPQLKSHGCRKVFVAPPNLNELECRLRSRGTDSEKSLIERLKKAREDMRASQERGLFDCFIENAQLEKAYSELVSILKKELPSPNPVRA